MNSFSINKWLLFYGKKTAIGFVFSSMLIQPFWTPSIHAAQIEKSAIISQQDSEFSRSLYRNIMNLADEYTSLTIAAVVNNKLPPSIIAPGPYYQIKIDSSSQGSDTGSTYYVAIDSGTVTLANPGKELFIADKNVNLALNPTGKGNATLILESGILNSSLSFSPKSGKDAVLLIGPGGKAVPKPSDIVVINGKIDGSNRPTISSSSMSRQSVIETQGMNLLVNGQVGNSAGKVISRINAYNGNVTVQNGTSADFYLQAYLLDVKSGFQVETLGKGIFTYAVNLEPDSMVHSSLDFEIRDMMGSANVDGKGLMQAGSKILVDQHIFLDAGISQAAGLIQADETIAGHGTNTQPLIETKLSPVNQGGTDPLSIKVTGDSDSGLYDILLGEMSLSSLDSHDDIISGTYTLRSNTDTGKDTHSLRNRVMKTGAFAKYSYYPGSTINADNIKAGKKLMAGGVNMPLYASSGSLNVGNAYIVKLDSSDDLENSTGNINIKNGFFQFSNDEKMEYDYKPEGENADRETRHLDTASQVDGNLSVTGNGESGFTTLAVGGTTHINGGTLQGNGLKTNALEFKNLSKLDITGSVPSPLVYNLDVATTLDMVVDKEELGVRNVDSTNVGGAASVTGGSYTGKTFHADSAVFDNVLGANFSESLDAATDITIQMPDSGSSSIYAISAGQNLSISGGEYVYKENNLHSGKGNTLQSGNATLANLKNFTISGKATIRGDLTVNGNTVSNFNNLGVDGAVNVKGGKFNAQSIVTGAKNNGGGDFIIKSGSFNFGGSSNAPALINGRLSATDNGESSFVNLEVKDELKVSNGALSGASVKAKSASLNNLAHLDISDGKLEVSQDASIQDSAARIGNSVIGGSATVIGGSYEGNTLEASGDASFNALGSLKLDSLTANNINVELAANGQANVDAVTANKDLNISGGNFSAVSISSGGDAFYNSPDENSSLSVSGTTKIGGNLSATGKGSSSFNKLVINGAVSVEGGSFKANSITTGSESGKDGNFTISDASVDLGSDVEEASVIHGSLTSSGSNSSHNFNNLNVDDMVKMDGGFLVGGSLHANSGVFSNNSIAHIDNLTLDGDVNGLQILDNSLVIVKSIKNSQGQDIVSGSGLIILGDIDNPDNWSEVGDFVLNGEDESGLLRATTAYVKAGNISGSGHGDKADDISVYRLMAQNINIQNANIQLFGMNENASGIENDLIISSNGNTRLGDIDVGGIVNIQGGSVQARKFSSRDATFSGVELNLLGKGEWADDSEQGRIYKYGSNINGNLELLNNKSASLGDISITKNLTATNGSLDAGIIDVGGNMSLTGTTLSLAGTESQPGQIGNRLYLNMNEGQISSLGHLVIKSSDLEVIGGTVNAERLEVGNDATVTGANLTLNASAEKPGLIQNNLILANNKEASLSYLTINGKLEATGGSLAAEELIVGNNAVINGAALNLNSIGNNRSLFKNNLEINANTSANLGRTTVSHNLTVTGGALEAQALDVGQAAAFTDVSLTLNGSETSPDHMGSLGIIYNNQGDSIQNAKKATVGWLTTSKDLDVTGGEFESTLLDIGGNATFSGVTLYMDGVESRPDLVKGDMSLTDKSNATIGHLKVEGKSSAVGGKINAHELISASLAFNAVDSEINTISVNNEAIFSDGTLAAETVQTADSTFKNGLVANLKSMMLNGKELNVGALQESKGNTLVRIAQLNLNAGQLNVVNSTGGNSILAVESFSPSASARPDINGNIAIGSNGRLVLGTRNENWLPATLADSKATLALAQVMRLGNGCGIHVAGEAMANPEANRIKFGADSLLVIDGRNPKVYYTGQWIKTALLNENYGVPGALSAESSSDATVSSGAQIYIRNPQPYTVIVALGENINTTYVDQDNQALQRASSGGAWTGENLRYDNDGPVKVKIERLGDGYEGQFSVMPLDSPSTPGDESPSTPGDNPPTTPDDNPPSTPATPGGNTPVEPGGDKPSIPDSSNPSGSGGDTPVSPVNPSKPSTTHPGANPGIHDVIDNETGKDNIGTDPKHLNNNNGSGFLSHTIKHENPHESTRLVEGGNRIVNLGGVPQLILTANKAVQDAISQRTRLGSIRFTEEDIYKRSISLWAIPIYKTSTAWNLEAGNLDYDYNGAIGGLTMGGDISFEDISRFGLAISFGGAYSASSGDMPETINNMTFWGLGAYGSWYPGNFSVSADLNFTSSYNKLKQDISMLDGWNDLKSDVQAYVLGAAINLEYLWKTDIVDIIPHAGIKYNFLHVFNYDVNHNGNTIIEGDAFDQNIWLFPVGVQFIKEINLDNGWLLKPSLDFRMTPAAGDIKSKTKTRFTNTDGEINLDTKIMDYLSWGAGAGLEASYGNFSLGINYSLEAGAQTLSNAIFGTLKYEF